MADEQCLFCMIAQNKIQSAKVLDDESCVAFLDIKPASKGHMQIIPKAHAPIFLDLDEPTRFKIFNIALNIGQTLIKKLGATGVSYIINEGVGAGQRVAHASIHAIPRYDKDEVSISWPDKQMNQEEFIAYRDEVISKVTAKAPSAEKPKEEKKEKPKEDIKLKPRVPRYW